MLKIEKKEKVNVRFYILVNFLLINTLYWTYISWHNYRKQKKKECILQSLRNVRKAELSESKIESKNAVITQRTEYRQGFFCFFSIFYWNKVEFTLLFYDKMLKIDESSKYRILVFLVSFLTTLISLCTLLHLLHVC